jgi:hypothetical protein
LMTGPASPGMPLAATAGCDVVEHVPPERVAEFLRTVRVLLRPGGILIVVTPNALTGPHDVTRHFQPPGTPPQGLHLREYTLRQLVELLQSVGFGSFLAPGPMAWAWPVWPARLGRGSAMVKPRLEPLISAMAFPVRSVLVDLLYYSALVARPI